MTLCPNTKGAQCCCQPQDGVMCPHGPTPPFEPWKPEPPMTTDTPAAAAITAERGHVQVLNALEILERAALGPGSQGTAADFLKCLGEGGMLVIANPLVPVAAQPADSAMEVLIELVAIDDLKRSHAHASSHASKFQSDENYAVVDKLATEIARRSIPAWIDARALTAARQGKEQAE